ncbi:MAG: DUF2809 domain-containing protein, partial [Sphingobacteriales bacterium]|nr:DUF2809 domain-containing protein [Sphingobacteriales bacterium]
ALYIHDKFIRPYAGDFLVVMLLYCFIKSCIKAPVIPTAIAVLLFAYFVEMSQYFQLVKILNLQNSKAATIILGNSFGWTDIITYTLGTATIIVIEKARHNGT